LPPWTELLRRRIRNRIARGGVLFAVALVLVGSAAALSANNLLFLILAAMLATLLISGFVSRLVLAGLELELLLPDHISARRPTSARIRLRNVKRAMPSFSIRVTGEPPDPILAVPLYFPILPGRRTLEESVQVIFPRRGAHTENLFLFSTRFPFGFVEKTARVTLRRETLVYPCLDPQPGFDALLSGILGELEQDARGQGSDFYHIRPYIPTESARHVDWKSTAHTGGLQVREFTREDLGAVEIFLDRADTAPAEWFERAVECCAFLVWELTQQNRGVTLLSQGFRAETDVYTMLSFLAFAAPLKINQPLPAPDDSAFQILFSPEPDTFRGEGWHPRAVVGLGDLPPNPSS